MEKTFEQILNTLPVRDWITDQVVVFDWHDGLIEGLCALAHPNLSFKFDVIAESRNPATKHERIFRLSHLSDVRFHEIMDLLRKMEPIKSPVWVPRFDNKDAKQHNETEGKLEKLLEDVAVTRILVQTPDMLTFERCWTLTGEFD